MNTLRKLLSLLEKKHPGFVMLILFDDESGRITEYTANPYDNDSEPLFQFTSLDELKTYLESE